MRGKSQGLTLTSAMRSRLRNREVSERKQVGDAESMVQSENLAVMRGQEEMM
jgi:hypothetical protein